MGENQNFTPPIFPPSGELGCILFAILPCLKEEFRPLASFAFHMTELTKLKSIPSVPSLSKINSLDALFMDKDSLLNSLSFYGRVFSMPMLSTLATLLQGLKFYQEYKDLFPLLFSGGSGDSSSGFSPESLMSIFSMFSGMKQEGDSKPEGETDETPSSQETSSSPENGSDEQEASSSQEGIPPPFSE